MIDLFIISFAHPTIFPSIQSNYRCYFQVSCDGSLSSITMTGLEIMLTSLVNQDVDTAIKIITNLVLNALI